MTATNQKKLAWTGGSIAIFAATLSQTLRSSGLQNLGSVRAIVLQRLHLAQKRAFFHRVVQGTQGLRVPSVLLQQRLPDAAAYEIQACFNQVIKNYSLKNKAGESLGFSTG